MNMAHFDHLKPEIAETLTWTTEDRIFFAQQNHWISYPRAKEIMTRLEDQLAHPRVQRMPNTLLVGESGNGKSTLIDRFREKHPVKILPSGEPLAPVIVMEMPSEPNEGRFWTELLLSLKIAHRDTDPVQRKENQAISVLTYVQAKMLIIDEIHNVLHGSARQQRHFLGMLKRLSNKLQLPLVAVGTRDSILALHTDTQLSSRFEPLALPRWQLDVSFLRLLASFERLLPLADPSQLSSQDIAIKLHSMSGGTIGGVASVLKRATVKAIREGKEHIDAKLLDDIGWVKLSDYGKEALKL
ncbi:transposase [Halomonas sp. N3-2A]|nr:transposase [Halomonas sp. N3-2A]